MTGAQAPRKIEITFNASAVSEEMLTRLAEQVKHAREHRQVVVRLAIEDADAFLAAITIAEAPA